MWDWIGNHFMGLEFSMLIWDFTLHNMDISSDLVSACIMCPKTPRRAQWNPLCQGTSNGGRSGPKWGWSLPRGIIKRTSSKNRSSDSQEGVSHERVSHNGFHWSWNVSKLVPDKDWTFIMFYRLFVLRDHHKFISNCITHSLLLRIHLLYPVLKKVFTEYR